MVSPGCLRLSISPAQFGFADFASRAFLNWIISAFRQQSVAGSFQPIDRTVSGVPPRRRLSLAERGDS
jgi:hypothetical protein